MGTRQTKGSLAERASPGAAPGPRRERPDFWASLLLRAGDKAGRAGAGSGLPPYHRRVGMVQELLRMVRQGRREEAGTLLQHLRQDLGMESTSLDDVLYRYASFRNLVDPITHDLIISLARYIHCPKPEGDALGAMEKLCRQLTYHLSPHSQWRRRRGLVKRKPQACLKAVLAGSPPDNTVDLSGIPLTPRDLERVTGYLQRCGEQVDSVELGFTGLTDDMALQLLPALSTLPRLTTLALNGNRLTRALLRDLTDALKDPSKFPSVTWIDLGNNVDIFSLPQPFLLSLRKRSPKQGHLPTILELGEGPGSGDEARDETVGQEDPGGDQEARETTGASQT
ncbi:leucine-rich repeat-containing protein 75A [Lagenorhynchus albirostris]|uniref:Leucine-rich repeat-containing protein 75A isoform X1 n=1 Tax=Tursiops truncatus TaxID=9739 RepID=A0A6J3QKM2_TURTR|nr:leucine-rich repeat-containing protein 75A [Lagenorhynchus obliquidens]XP_033702767.1 leucine-rich repeat-containing protein 75A isoform X1 [Tursiops truncatus]XP_059854106.1 leucine-rich repeat-containing protein 75A [Delphinus delphis]XP_059991878.1 leucine-rich repeat-containing protein 75A [Lagenorhynchus albirostris]XP_060146962.1 leucine-rich repeat-containing protein 75A [Globicephala melas]